MRLEANSVEPGAVRLIITRHAYAKKPRKEPGEDGDEVIYISGGTELVSRRKDSRPGVWLPRKHDEKKKNRLDMYAMIILIIMSSLHNKACT